MINTEKDENFSIGDIIMFITKHVAAVGPNNDATYWNDYIGNSDKDFATLCSTPMSNTYWTDYGTVSTSFETAGKVKFRGKYVDSANKLHVVAIWDSETERRNFETQADISTFNAVQTFSWESITENVIDANTAATEIQTVIDSGDYLIRYCAPELQTTGMVIGDPLLGQVQTTVS